MQAPHGSQSTAVVVLDTYAQTSGLCKDEVPSQESEFGVQVA